MRNADKIHMHRLLFPESGGEGAPSGPRTEPEVAQSAQPPVNPPAVTPPAVPPAAQTVVSGEVTEETLRLKEQLAEKDRVIRQRETEVSESQRQLQTLKESIEKPAPVPVKKKPAPEDKPFRIGRFRI